MNLRIKYILLIVGFISINASAQVWLDKLPQNKSLDSLTFYDYQEAFNSYWEPYNVKGGYFINSDGDKQKAPGWKIFKRWEYYWESRIDRLTGKFPTTSSIDEYKKWLAANSQNRANLRNTRSLNGDWQSLGPSSSDGGYEGIGRLNCIAFHPSDNNTYWVGSPSGGLWVTTNDGAVWAVLTDENDVLGVSDIAVSTNYPIDNTLYIATGDRDGGSMWSLGGGQSNDNNSIGVLKSTDGGNTWNTTGLSFTVSQKHTINRLLIDPANNDILYAATSAGLYKTIDAGTNWNQLTATIYIDLEFKPGDSSIIYASNRDGDIDRSTDSGANFNTVLNTLNDRVDLAVTADNTAVVYAVMDGSNGLGGVYKSTDSGASFSQAYSGNKNLLGWECDGSDNGDQGSYDLCIAVDPTDVNTVFIGGVNSWKSTDGGANWSIDTHWSGNCGGNATAVHADKHFLAYQNGTTTLFQCNDGGVYKTTNSGGSWTDKTNGIVHSQIYRIGVSQTQATATITGLQDNGSKLLHTDGNWRSVKGGDGMECIIDYTNYDVQYATYVQGQISRTTDLWNSTTSIEPPGYPGFWVTPYIIDPNANQTLYAGYEDVYKTTDRGNTWSKISSINTGQNLRSMAIAPSNSDYLYVADPNQLWVTTNGGGSWTERTSGLPVGSNSITYLAVKDDDPDTVWVTFGGYDGNRVYQSIDAGQNWVNISTGLPSLPVMTIIQNKLNTADVELYVGTDVGVYVKIGSDNWQAFNSGLPNVVVNELDIYYDTATPDNSRLRAGTSGRGLWETDLYTPPSGPMVYDSSTTTQDNTSDTYRGNNDREIIGVEIVTTGNQNAIDATSFTFNTNGSTDITSDVVNAKLYFTGTSAVFAASNQFGATVVDPNGSFTITGAQTLSSGTNHFWLTYDIDAAATIGDVVDAECTSITVDGTVVTPTVTAPAGNRQIASCVHCYSWGNTDYATSTTRVLFNTIDNTSAKPTDANDNAYSDYTNLSTELVRGDDYNLTVQVNTDGNYEVLTKVWVDWNQDCDFDDPGEEYDLGNTKNEINGATSNSPLSVTVPLGALLGNTTIRVSSKYTNSNAGDYPTSCETNFDGEVEDYTLTIVNCLSANQTVWDGNAWSNGPPDDTKPVVIDGAYNTNTANLICCELTINNNASLTINSGQYVQIEHDFSNDGTIDILHEGSLVQVDDDTTISGTGVYYVHKTTPIYADYDYTYWSSPTQSETIGSVFAANPPDYIFRLETANFSDMNDDTFDDNADDWQGVAGATTMTPGVGYIAMGEGSPFPIVLPPAGTQSQSVVFDGALNNGVINVSVSLDAYNTSGGTGHDSFNTNANLIGNPYASAIDINQLYASNNTLLEGTFYFWTHDSAISSSNAGPDTYNFTNDDYATVTTDGTTFNSVKGGSNGTTASQYIATGQGFLANVTANGTLVFNNAMRVTGNNTHFLRNNNSENIDRIWLNLKNDAGVFRQILVGFNDNATDDYRKGQDGQRLENGINTDFYSVIQGDSHRFAIQNLAAFNDAKTINLGIEIVEAGTYEINLDHFEGVFMNGQHIYLEDVLTGILHDFTNGAYSFSSEVVDNDLRFVLRFTNSSLTVEENELDALAIYPNPSSAIFNISYPVDDAISIEVYDLTGKILKQQTGLQIDLSGYAKGVYFAKLRVNGLQTVKKLVLR